MEDQIICELKHFWTFVEISEDGFIFGYTRDYEQAEILRLEYQKNTVAEYNVYWNDGNFPNHNIPLFGMLTIIYYGMYTSTTHYNLSKTNIVFMILKGKIRVGLITILYSDRFECCCSVK